MKRKYQESYNVEILFDFFRSKGISVDSIKKQVYGNDDFIHLDFPLEIPDISFILYNLNNNTSKKY